LEELKGVEKAVVRNRELAEQAIQKAEELLEIE
jgi:hypothetical protein